MNEKLSAFIQVALAACSIVAAVRWRGREVECDRILMEKSMLAPKYKDASKRAFRAFFQFLAVAALAIAWGIFAP